MAETEQITVASVSEGPAGSGEPDTEVALPVVELLTGRGFITGKSGSGKSNSASVIAEKLLDNGFGLLIVDIDGEYYGLKEAYEILHVGADEECDIQITTDHAEKIASLALEQNVPIILDVSSFLDEDEAEEVLTAVARHLFAKAKKQKQPFLLLVEEVHEYIPENGSVGECGKMLIKIGKRGRKHGLGMVGISQRPADVKKDFITQCDWLVWHRLTWNNDTKVVRRILDGEYAEAVEDLGDGEGFLVTDWSGSVRRVQFQRKQTFDAGATPGLEDFERPDLKSVSDNLVSELEEISEQKQAREDRIAQLRAELDKKNSRIAELEAELQDARDMSRMADQFVDALIDHVHGENPGRTEKERMRDRRQPDDWEWGPEQETPEPDTEPPEESSPEAVASAISSVTDGGTTSENGDSPASSFSASELMDRLKDSNVNRKAREKREQSRETDEQPRESEPTSAPESVEGQSRDEATEPSVEEIIEADGDDHDYGIVSAPEDETAGDGEAATLVGEEEPLAVRELKAELGGLETKARKMLTFYREFGPGTPLNAHFAAGGDGDRTGAYAHNRALRTSGVIEHVGRGKYDYRLREFLREQFEGHVDEEAVEAYARNVEQTALDFSVAGDA